MVDVEPIPVATYPAQLELTSARVAEAAREAGSHGQRDNGRQRGRPGDAGYRKSHRAHPGPFVTTGAGICALPRRQQPPDATTVAAYFRVEPR